MFKFFGSSHQATRLCLGHRQKRVEAVVTELILLRDFQLREQFAGDDASMMVSLNRAGYALYSCMHVTHSCFAAFAATFARIPYHQLQHAILW